jgi:hypothetical protein
MKERQERFPCLELLKRMKRSFDDPGKADTKTGRRRRAGRLTKVRRSFDDPGKVDEKLGGAEEQVG